MKFTKTVVAVAIAGIAAMPLIASADTTLSGLLELQLKGDDRDLVDDAATADVDESLGGDAKIAAGDVFIQVNTAHELNNGLTGYGNIRQDMNALSNEGSVSTDSIYVGIKGGFGDVRIGEIPLAVEVGQVANDLFDVGDEINGGVSYVGSFGPVGLTANFSPEPNQDAVGIGAKFGIGGFSIGVGAEDRGIAGSDESSQNASAGVSFAFAGASIAAHFSTREFSNKVAGGEDEESIAVKVGYGFGGVSAGLTFATLEGSGNDFEASAIRLDLGYGLGGGMEVSTRITAITIDDSAGGALVLESSSEDQTQWRIQLNKSF